MAAAVEAAGLTMIALANGLALALCGAVAMGAAFALLYPSLSLVVVNRVPEERRGSAIGTFTAFFDLGVGLGAPLAGAAAAVAGYPAAFWLGAAGGLASGIVITFGLRGRRLAVPALLALGALALAACGGGTSQEPRPRAAAHSPNVIVVMTDDQDTQSVGVMHAVGRDLAAKGVTFSHNFVTTPECCPSRATFLTGQYAHNTASSRRNRRTADIRSSPTATPPGVAPGRRLPDRVLRQVPERLRNRQPGLPADGGPGRLGRLARAGGPHGVPDVRLHAERERRSAHLRQRPVRLRDRRALARGLDLRGPGGPGASAVLHGRGDAGTARRGCAGGAAGRDPRPATRPA